MITFLSRAIFIIFAFAFVLFFSSEIILSQLAYSIFDIDLLGNFVISVPKEEAFITIKNYAMLCAYKISFYGIAVLFGILQLIVCKSDFKNNSYNFLILIFILISFFTIAPIYFYEIRLSMAIFLDGVNSFDDGSINAFFIERFKSPSFSILSGFSFLSNITVIFTYLLSSFKK